MESLAARGWPVYALDLRGHGDSSSPDEVDLAHVTMSDYLADVEGVADQITGTPIVVGWSMGGLIAQMYAARRPQTPALVLLAPSPPAAVSRETAEETIQTVPDLFGPEAYGIKMDHPTGGRVLRELGKEMAAQMLSTMSMESGEARRERLRGVVIPRETVHCPVLIVHGEHDNQFPPVLMEKMVDYYEADSILAPGRVGHWGVVAGPAVDDLAPRVDAWLREHVG